MATLAVSVCPGCGLNMPVTANAHYQGYYNTSPECWSIYAEVLGAEFSNAVIFGQVHQMTVDTYAVQHAGGIHKHKSVAIHLAGLHLVLEQGVRPTRVPDLLQRMARAVEEWPHFSRPAGMGSLTIWDVAIADSPQEHVDRVQAWARQVWAAWAESHMAVAELVGRSLAPE